MQINKEELLEKIEATYGDLDNPCGSIVNGEWLTVKAIVNLIEECEEYNG